MDSKLSQELKSIVWVLRVIKNGKISYCTGFCVKNDGLIMTSAHGMHEEDCPNLEFRVRRIDDDGFNYKAKVVSQFPNWDITVLQVEGGVVQEFGAGHFGRGSINEGDSLLLIGHPHLLVGSFLYGYAAYECTPNATLPAPTDELTCFEYESTASTITPPYRVLGHVLNKKVYDGLDANVSGYVDDLRSYGNAHPLTPIIQTNGFGCGPGASGAPLFNIKGEIVGMHVYDSFGYYTAIHVSMLKEAFRIALSVLDRKRKAEVGDEHSIIEDVKGKKLKI